jgi:hypothetical protein
MGVGGGERRMVEGLNSIVTYLIYCMNLLNTTMYPHPA